MTTVGVEMEDNFFVVTSILLMNLLIALLITPDEKIHQKTTNDQWLEFAKTTFELSNGSRFLPAPFGIYVMLIAVIIHIINFFFAMIDPSSLNFYNMINHYQYTGLVAWRHSINCCFQCRKKKEVDEDRKLSGERKKEIYQKRRCLNCFEVGVCRPRQYCRQKLHQHCDCCCVEEVELFTKEAADSNITQSKKCCCCTPKKPCCLRKLISCYTEIRDGICCESNFSRDTLVYELKTRQRVYVTLIECVGGAFLNCVLLLINRLKYYASAFLCCELRCLAVSERFDVHHTGCFSCIPSDYGLRGMNFGEYANIYEQHQQTSLDLMDLKLLKSLSGDTLFCPYCFKPFDPLNKYGLDKVLMTPFRALLEVLSIYFSYLFFPALAVVLGVQAAVAKTRRLMSGVQKVTLFESNGSSLDRSLDERPI